MLKRAKIKSEITIFYKHKLDLFWINKTPCISKNNFKMNELFSTLYLILFSNFSYKCFIVFFHINTPCPCMYKTGDNFK